MIATVSAFHSLRHSFHLSLAVLIFGLFSACLKSPSAPPVQEPTTITLSTYRIVFTAINESIRIDATVLDQDSRVITDATVHWRSADNSVARVSDRGVVTAAGSGTTQISVSSGYATATATVSVEQEASSIEISPSAITISQVGGTGRFTAVVYDANNRPIPDAAVVWSSSNPEIATVDANGRLTAVSRGSALITASSGGVSTSRPVFVEVPRVPSRVVLNVTEATLATVGQSLQLDAQVYDSAGAAIPGAAVAWTSSRPEIATVDASGLVIAVANGTTRITASSRGVSAQAIIHVVIEDTEPPEPPPVPPEPPPPPPEPPGTSADREALIAFYHATDGPNWMDNTKWLSENPLNEWYGVSTDADGRVTKLSLRENQLTGSIPPEIEQLQNLILLNLSRNRITGTIPPVFGKMNALRYLHLGDNQLTGEIPPETYQSNTLMILSLFDNQLSGEIPPAIGKLANLIDLHLSTNQFTGHIPPEIGQLSNLAYLALNGNQLTGVIPHEIGQLLNLGSLSLEGNRLTGVIPHEIGQLEKLNGLLLNDNLLTGEIPSEIGQLVNLNGLVLHGNRLTGEIPSEIGQLVGLKSLILSDNQLSGGLPPEIGQLNKMDRLILNDNRDLSGPLPIELVNVPLVQLRLQNTQLCAPLNAGFQMWLAGIEDKSVENCATMPGPNTDPEPPPSSDTSSDRDALIAFYHATDGPNWTDNTNWLSDEPIGTWYGVATDNEVKVIDLRLSENNLLGMIPPEIGQLGSLKVLDLGQNQLTGSIPPEIGMLSKLTDLFLEYNQISGAIPVEIGRLGNLEWLVLRSNELTGTIPTEILSFESLRNLWLNHNRLTGPIPPEIGQLSSLELLSLQYNRLEGVIPPEVGKLTNLDGLDVSANELTGSIPPEIGQLTRLTHIELFNNKLTGPLPPEIGKLTELSWLFFSHNDFTGSIPPEFGRLTNLKQLILTRNTQMSGRLPLELVNVPLERLKLQDTQLCAPLNAGFQMWLAGIEDRRVENCAITR